MVYCREEIFAGKSFVAEILMLRRVIVTRKAALLVLPYVSICVEKRVKVYRLNEDGKWDDQGTGHVTVDYLERSEELALYFLMKRTTRHCLCTVSALMTFTENKKFTVLEVYDINLYFPFITPLLILFLYHRDHICNVQRNIHFSSLNSETFHSMNSELSELPAVELSTLPIILKVLMNKSFSGLHSV
ncbi:serine/threonine-protein phosphatase 4 regulatory subunit 3A-like isoform X5 [Gossypium australe]|uniref:Serine/threonine-protein phosphatase 4 regulatory subunit 3A-like isoform X5 n=1 Tax=Gossypium australe TaxID=47621 RepID=A0A5B6WBJ8_9ROSI|nr:serine/threonine-protein phosphatase 4 regulatory subunit 3A-like isoform X5 [Gossypium australe]